MVSGSHLCRSRTLSGEVWIYGFMAFQTKRISAPGLENKTPNIFLMHPMLNACNPSSYTYELIFKFRVSSKQEFTCTVQAVPAESSCNCWDHFKKLTIYPIYLMSGATIESLCPPLFSDLNMLSKWTYQLCSGSFWPFHTLNWNKWQILWLEFDGNGI